MYDSPLGYLWHQGQDRSDRWSVARRGGAGEHGTRRRDRRRERRPGGTRAGSRQHRPPHPSPAHPRCTCTAAYPSCAAHTLLASAPPPPHTSARRTSPPVHARVPRRAAGAAGRVGSSSCCARGGGPTRAPVRPSPGGAAGPGCLARPQPRPTPAPTQLPWVCTHLNLIQCLPLHLGVVQPTGGDDGALQRGRPHCRGTQGGAAGGQAPLTRQQQVCAQQGRAAAGGAAPGPLPRTCRGVKLAVAHAWDAVGQDLWQQLRIHLAPRAAGPGGGGGRWVQRSRAAPTGASATSGAQAQPCTSLPASSMCSAVPSPAQPSPPER